MSKTKYIAKVIPDTLVIPEDQTHAQPEHEDEKSRRCSKTGNFANAANTQIRVARLEKKMGVIDTSHLREIEELQLAIETTWRSAKNTETTQRPLNNMRRATERTRKAEKNEKLNRERSADKETDRCTSRENLLNNKQGRKSMIREEGNYSVSFSSHTGRNTMESQETMPIANGRRWSNNGADRPSPNRPEGSTTVSVKEDEM